MALQSVIKIDHTLSISISISIWVVDQSLAHDQQKVIKRSNRSRSAIDHHKSEYFPTTQTNEQPFTKLFKKQSESKLVFDDSNISLSTKTT